MKIRFIFDQILITFKLIQSILTMYCIKSFFQACWPDWIERIQLQLEKRESKTWVLVPLLVCNTVRTLSISPYFSFSISPFQFLLVFTWIGFSQLFNLSQNLFSCVKWSENLNLSNMFSFSLIFDVSFKSLPLGF